MSRGSIVKCIIFHLLFDFEQYKTYLKSRKINLSITFEREIIQSKYVNKTDILLQSEICMKEKLQEHL